MRGKKTSVFVRPQNLPQVRTQLANDNRFRRLADPWIELTRKQARAEFQK
jgi:hypothetical protein